MTAKKKAADCPECEICCALGICCPAGSTDQRQAVIAVLQRRDPSLSNPDAADKADEMLAANDGFRSLRAASDAAGLTDAA